MMIRELATEVTSDDQQATIVLHGDIDEAAEAQLNQAYDAAAATNPSSILLDFDDVGYINSTGLALIVGVLAAARKAKIALHARGLSEHYRELFQITRLADFISLL